MQRTPVTLLKRAHLKDTQTRRIVLTALARLTKPVSPYDLQRKLQAKSPLGIVTIYRILEAFEKAHIIHKHPCNGMFSLCTMPDTSGHHGFLHCHDCGKVEEFASKKLCAIEHGIAHKAGFRAATHVSEIAGTCKHCR